MLNYPSSSVLSNIFLALERAQEDWHTHIHMYIRLAVHMIKGPGTSKCDNDPSQCDAENCLTDTANKTLLKLFLHSFIYKSGHGFFKGTRNRFILSILMIE